jgi:benzoate 4-monooxygenase
VTRALTDFLNSTLSALCYYLATHLSVQRRLQAELDQYVPLDPSVSPDPVVNYEQVKNLSYLNACVKETFRLHSTLGTGLPRIVPPGKTFTFGGQTFKAGSVISVPSFTINHSCIWGPDAEEFRPERWLEDSSGTFNKYYMPFSTGPR